VHPTKVVSVNEPCSANQPPFLNLVEGVKLDAK